MRKIAIAVLAIAALIAIWAIWRSVQGDSYTYAPGKTPTQMLQEAGQSTTIDGKPMPPPKYPQPGQPPHH